MNRSSRPRAISCVISAGPPEGQLRTRTFLVGDRYTIADIALYAYTHVAHEGGFDLGRYPAVRAWIAAVQAQPDYVGMDG